MEGSADGCGGSTLRGLGGGGGGVRTYVCSLNFKYGNKKFMVVLCFEE